MENAATLPRTLKNLNIDQPGFELPVEGMTCALTLRRWKGRAS